MSPVKALFAPVVTYPEPVKFSLLAAIPAPALTSALTIPVTVASSTRMCSLALVIVSVLPYVVPRVTVAILYPLVLHILPLPTGQQ